MSPNYSPAGDGVLSAIEYLGQQNAALELTKSFRGMLVQQDVRVLEVNSDDEDAAFRVTDIEMCAALDGEVHLHSQSFPKPVTAQLKSLNLSKGMLVLSDFAYTENEWKKRRHERVQPRRPTYVNLHCKDIEIRACMENISVKGIGVLAFKISEKGLNIEPGSNIQLDFKLPPDYKFTDLRGKVVYLNMRSEFSATIIGIQLFPKTKEARALRKYIAQRKQEILRELTQAYWELSQPRGVESLYF